jgi:hypothetical protein
MGSVKFDNIAIFNVTYMDTAPHAVASVVVKITSQNAEIRGNVQDATFVEYMRRCIADWFRREGQCVVETPEEYEEKLAKYRRRTPLQLVKKNSQSPRDDAADSP